MLDLTLGFLGGVVTTVAAVLIYAALKSWLSLD